jgi:pilus assembly protein CpaD
MMKQRIKITISALMCVLVCACAPQYTPSMMNANKPQLVEETTLQQLPVRDVSDGYLRKLADDYTRYGAGTLNIAISYDPKSSSYTAMKAFHDLSDIKSRLKKLGILSVKAETLTSEGGLPTLMVSFDGVKAAAPRDCTLLPGLEDSKTTRYLGEYKMGCSIDTMLARQIYRPADLAGNDQLDPGDGRRAANSTEHYRVVTPEEATRDLEVLGRDQVQN